MLELRPTCEHCNKSLPVDSTEAMICTYECTFCCSCVENILENVCPNCGGGFVPRPIRPKTEWVKGVSLNNQPAQKKVTYKPVDLNRQKELIKIIKQIAPERR